MREVPSSTFLATDGDGYELTMGRWSRRLARLVVDFAGIGDAKRVLDVGCGTGHLTAEIGARSNLVQVVGVDMSPAYVAHARAHYPSPGLTFQVGDACALEFPDGTFDGVLSQLVLHFVPRAEDAVAEMRRVATSGATVAAAVWDARGGLVAHRMFADTAAAIDPKAGELRARSLTRPMTRPGELAAAWRGAGLVDVEDTALSIRMEFSSFADFWAPYLGREGPGAEYVGSLTAAERARLESAMRAAYVDGEPDGPRSYAAAAWAVKGRVP
jgi:SAM-dependent methyltransferase